MTLLFAVTYETISDESSRNGDIESSGFIAPDGTEIPAIIDKETPGVYMPFKQAMALFDQERECHMIEPDGNIRYPHVPGNKPRRFTDYGQIGASWGDVRNVTLHLPESITVSSAIRIARILGVVN
jgi:hypothetical protein